MANDTISEMKEQVAEAAATAQEKVAEFGRSVESAVNDTRKPAADALESTAAVLRHKVSGLRMAAGKLESTADYVREHDARGMLGDVGRFVKSHPGKSLVSAAVVGFLLGRAFRNR
jgi:ElaB/YqjD/DUF883 family membrane-anchored ribosome-binding protein